MVPQRGPRPNPQNLSMLVYIWQKGLGRFVIKDLILRWGDYPDYSRGPDVITRVLIWERGKQKSQRGCDNGNGHQRDAGP